MSDRICVVDDDPMSLRLVRRVFDRASIEGAYLSTGAELVASLDADEVPDLFLLDVHMPDANGFDLLRQIRESPRHHRVPVIFLTGDDDVRTETAGLHAGASDFIRKPFAPEVLLTRVRNTIELNRLHDDMATEIRQQTERLSRVFVQIVQALAASVDAKDTYTHGHSSRVATYAREIARRCGYGETEQDSVYMMGLLHDVGKIGVSDAIINKPARLTDEEFAEIKRHPGMGADILHNISEFPELAIGARWHHERFDGGGYPDGLAGTDIPEIARMIAVADTYDAMTSNRSYRSAMSQDTVRAEIARCRGTQLDPRFADVMLQMIDEDTDFQMRED